MTDEDSVLDNIEIHKNFAIISVNPKLYPLSVIYSAAYWLLDRVHVIIDGDPDTEILIEIRPKDKDKKVDIKEIGYEFNDELINYSVYTVQATRNKRMREMILENALAGNLRNQPTPINPPRPQPSQQLPRTFKSMDRCDCSPDPNNQIQGTWKPAQQPPSQIIPDIKQNEMIAKNSELFQQDTNEDNITKVAEYRHRSEDF